MQKLYQTFVAQAAQLQSVHENVKVGSLLPLLSFKKYTMIKVSWAFLRKFNWLLLYVCCYWFPIFLLVSDPEAPVPLLPSGFPRRFYRCLWVQTCFKQKVAEHAQSYNGARTVLQRSQCCSRCHGSHADPATAANSRSDCLQVLESSAPLFPYSKEGEKGQMHHLEFGSFVCLGFFKLRLLNG